MATIDAATGNTARRGSGGTGGREDGEGARGRRQFWEGLGGIVVKRGRCRMEWSKMLGKCLEGWRNGRIFAA